MARVPPDALTLLPPLLACLPTAFVSPRPPPALLPLLSPILRQRVQLLSSSASSSDRWLQLLCWNPERAAKLADIVENLQLEPHPVSGEIEIGDVGATQYRRLDAETLQARTDSESNGLCFIFLWCMGDDKGGGDGWRLAELRALEDGEDGSTWYDSISDADESAAPRRGGQTSTSSVRANGVNGVNGTAAGQSGADDDDAYWAAYDRTPGRTPAKRSPAPASGNIQMPSNSELEYFARYMAEVQPAMDPHDPSEEGLPPGESTLNGDQTTRISNEHGTGHEQHDTNDLDVIGNDSSEPASYSNGVRNDSKIGFAEEHNSPEIAQPRPSSSSSHGSVDKLEQNAETQSQAEVAIKQHISTDLKSLFRLARSAGIERGEFERIVKTELECLSMMDLDE